MSKKKILLSVLFIMVIITGCFFGFKHIKNDSIPKEELLRFSQGSYDSVLLSMHSASGYSQEDFSAYGGLNTLISAHEILNMDELEHYLNTVFSTDNTISKIFLLLDPEMIWDACGQSDSRWDKELRQGLFSFVSAHPEISFEILLPYPSLTYWLNREQADLENALSLYHSFIEDAYEYPNIRTFYMGFEDWMLSNPDNYISDFETNAVVTRTIFLSCFCDGAYQITPVDDQFLFDRLRELTSRERTSPSVYPDLSDRCLIFFGDSIIANSEGSYSIPGYVTGLSGAAAYNYAVGGSSASADSPDTSDFPNILSDFLADYCVNANGTYHFSPGGTDLSDKKLCFLLNFGLNDYFKGAPVENPEDPYDITTYTGGLRCCLKVFMTLFPDADFIIMTPTYTNYFSNGMDHNSDAGGVLTDYVSAAKALAEELNIYCMDNYHDLGIDDSNLLDYSSDGCHPNEDGRILIARHIIRFIGSL